MIFFSDLFKFFVCAYRGSIENSSLGVHIILPIYQKFFIQIPPFSVTVVVNEPTSIEKVELLLQNLLWDGTYDPIKILRLKASVNLSDERTILIQGVNDTYDIVPAKEKRTESVFILIAKFIDESIVKNAILSTLK